MDLRVFFTVYEDLLDSANQNEWLKGFNPIQMLSG